MLTLRNPVRVQDSSGYETVEPPVFRECYKQR
jgi:hypothetical protein